MKKLFLTVLPAVAMLSMAALAPQTASARDWHGNTMTTTVHTNNDQGMRRDGDRDMRRGHHNGWRQHCRMVTVKHWNRWQHRMVYSQTRVCR